MKPITVFLCSLCVLLIGLLFQYSHLFLPDKWRVNTDKSGQGYAGPPVAMGHAHFTETFPSKADFKARWIVSKSKKDNKRDLQYEGRWKVQEPWSNPLPNDLGLVLKTKSRHHAVSVMLNEPFIFSDKPFVLQYEVRFQDGQSCGGGYLKLLSQTKDLDLNNFNDKTQYTIMFGPDICGNVPKIQFIMQHRNPLTGLYEEKNLKDFARSIDSSLFDDRRTHLYSLVILPNNSFEIYIDQDRHFSGNLLTDMSPPINPPWELPDPDDQKPKDWDDRKQIPDPDAVKPDDWDESEPNMLEDRTAVKPLGWLDNEPLLVPDPTAEKPENWDFRRGEWERPSIRNPKCVVGCGPWNPPMYTNPKYRGVWQHPMIDNPDYKGEWRQKMMPNLKYFQDLHPFKMTAIAAIGLELWSVSRNILFDNFIITDDISVAEMWAADSWVYKRAKEMEEPQEKEPGIYRTVVEAAEDQPYLWSIVAVLVIVPAVVVIFFCFMHAQNGFLIPTGHEGDGSIRVDVPIPVIKTDERSADESSVANQDSAATEASSGDNSRDTREADNYDSRGTEASSPADCEGNWDVGRGEELQDGEESLDTDSTVDL